jgi:hypothetical protein
MYMLLLLLLLGLDSMDRRRDGRTAAGGGAAGLLLLLLLLLLTPETARPSHATLLTLTSLGGMLRAEPKALPKVFKNELSGCRQ